MKRRMFSALLLSILHLPIAVAGQAATDEFFKGKTVRLLIGVSAGGALDDWGRFVAQHLGKHIPGNPDIVAQNMPGAGTVTAANQIYNVAKPDGLTLGLVNPGIYVDQLLGAKEIRFEWPKFSFIGSPERVDQVLFVRADSSYKTLEEIRRAKEPPRCGATGRSGLAYFLPRLLEEALGLKINMVVGYGGGGDMNLAIERGELHCRAGTVSAYVGREPTSTWMKNGFTRALVQSGATRYPKLPDVPTLYELMEGHKTLDATRRVAKVMLSSGDFGRPFIAPPATPPDRVKILREAFAKTMNDPALLADAKKRKWDLDLTTGETLEALAKEVMVQSPEVIGRVKKLMEN